MSSAAARSFRIAMSPWLSFLPFVKVAPRASGITSAPADSAIPAMPRPRKNERRLTTLCCCTSSPVDDGLVTREVEFDTAMLDFSSFMLDTPIPSWMGFDQLLRKTHGCERYSRDHERFSCFNRCNRDHLQSKTGAELALRLFVGLTRCYEKTDRTRDALIAQISSLQMPTYHHVASF